MPEEFPSTIAWRHRPGFWDDVRWTRRYYYRTISNQLLELLDPYTLTFDVLVLFYHFFLILLQKWRSLKLWVNVSCVF